MDFNSFFIIFNYIVIEKIWMALKVQDRSNISELKWSKISMDLYVMLNLVQIDF